MKFKDDPSPISQTYGAAYNNNYSIVTTNESGNPRIIESAYALRKHMSNPTYFGGIAIIEGKKTNYHSSDAIVANNMVQPTSSNPVLTFDTPNPDLKYFRPGDVVQGGAKYSDGFDLPVSSSGGGGGLETVFSNVPYENSIHALWNGPDTLTWSIPSGITGSKLTIDYTAYGGDFNVYVNDVFYKKYVYQGGTPDKMEIDIPDEGIKSIRWTWTIDYFAFHKAYVDGSILVDGVPVQVVSRNVDNNTMVVDGGEWSDGSGVPGDQNQAEVWSDYAIGGTVNSLDNVFNGSLPTLNNETSSSTNCTTPLTFTPPDFTEPGSVSSLVIIGSKNAGVSRLIKVDGVEIPCPDDNKFHELTVSVTSFSSIVAEHNGIDGSCIAGIYVNGELLVDAAGDTKVTGPAKSGTGTFVSTNSTDTVTIKDSNDQWIDNQNRLGLGFYIKDSITVLNADNPKHVALQQAIADAFAAYPNKVVQRRSAISSLVTQVASTLSDEDAALLYEITDVNAPIAVNGYYPLYTNEADANSAGNGSSHSHTFNGTTYYMPNGVTFYHGNYGTNSY